MKPKPIYSQIPLYVYTLNTDTLLLQTVCFVPGKRKPYIFSKFKPLNTDTPLIGTLSMAPLDFQKSLSSELRRSVGRFAA